MRAWLLLTIVLLPVQLVSAQGRLTAKLDKFGNPIGNHSLAANGAFEGKRLLIWGASNGPSPIFAKRNPLFDGLREKGFDVVTRVGSFDPSLLREVDQLWIISGMNRDLQPPDVDAIVAFAKSGKGLYICGDNAPYVTETNSIAGELFGVTAKGDYYGTKTIAVRGRGLGDAGDREKGAPLNKKQKQANKTAEDLRNKLPGLGARIQNSQVSHYVDAHALLTGINFIYEGVTISHLTPNSKLTPVLIASDGKILASVAKDPKLKVIVDCGFTRYYPEYINTTAGTLRYAENIAAYLMGAEGAGSRSVIELLDLAAKSKKAKERSNALSQLQRTDPPYDAVKEHIAALWTHTQSADDEVSSAARRQLQLAFRQARISHCLYWIAQSKSGLDEVIWGQVDARIRRADELRRASYHRTALKVVTSSDFNDASRAAAMELLLRLKDTASTEPVIEALIELPRPLWPRAALLLKALTGKDFGPRAGAELAEVIVSAKRWRQWLQDQEGRGP